MASLLELLFDTMPLTGARHAALSLYPGTFSDAPLNEVKTHVVPFSIAELSLLGHSNFDPNPGVNTEWDGTKTAIARSDQAIWSFDASSNFYSVQNLQCRSEQEGYSNCLVLESIEFGGDFGKGFDNSVEIALPSGAKRELRLSSDALIATFKVSNGTTGLANSGYWPMEGHHDQGFVHAFLFEIAPITGDVVSANSIQDPELDKFQAQVKRLRPDVITGANDKVGSLFADNAWQVLPTSQAVVAEVVDQMLQKSPFWTAAKVVSSMTHRVLVCCMLTLNKPSDDFVPGRVSSGWGARLFPVIMVNSTHPLGSVRAGIRHVRPATTTITPLDPKKPAECHCKEMNKPMASLLMADSNVNGDVDLGWLGSWRGPIPLWNRLFAYYLPNASSATQRAWVQVVARNRTQYRTLRGVVQRLDDDSGDVLRVPRQGAFDNIHLAPTMKMPKVTSVRPTSLRGLVGGSHTLTDADRSDWHFDDVVMAPVCAHDCFHFHWRWGQQLVHADDVAAKGWAGGQPYQIEGGPLVPTNQDVSIRLPDSRSVDYQAQATGIGAGEWQIINHHGADYALWTGVVVDAGRSAQDAGFTPLHSSDEMPEFLDDSQKFIPLLKAIDHWAVFYWRNRYYLDTDTTGKVTDWTPRERTQIWDMSMILTESRASSRGS